MNDAGLDAVAPATLGGLSIAVTGDRALAWSGEFAHRDPVAEVGPHVRRIHDAAAGGGELVVDVRGLSFVNSSALRVFLDWVAWIAAEPAERRYPLRFVTSPKATWQAAAFPAIVMLGAPHVTASHG
ncbi:MAG: hypothetical protein R3A52_11415 [Polyangiales bacterium]